MTKAPSIKEALEQIIAKVTIDPGDDTVHPDIGHVLARGFHAMGWANPQAASCDMIEAVASALRHTAPPDTGAGKSTVSPSDALTIINGMKLFGLASDGSDLRDLETYVVGRERPLSLPDHGGADAGVNVSRDVLLTLISVLDCALGDTDPSIDPDYTDDEVKRDYPVFWVCQQLATLSHQPAPVEKIEPRAENDSGRCFMAASTICENIADTEGDVGGGKSGSKYLEGVYDGAIRCATVLREKLTDPPAPVQDTFLVGGTDLLAMSGDTEGDHIIKLHFRRRATDKDRAWLLEAINAKIAADRQPAPAAANASAEAITEADIRAHVGGGMVSMQNVIDAANAILATRASAELQNDLSEMLRALGMSDAAQPRSPHDVFQSAISEMKRQIANASAEARLRLSVSELIEEMAKDWVAKRWRKTFREDCKQLVKVALSAHPHGPIPSGYGEYTPITVGSSTSERTADVTAKVRSAINGIYGLGYGTFAGGYQDESIEKTIKKIVAIVACDKQGER
ncbi:hypothetical protein [Nitrobacter sp. TKz-YC02]|uniref:hypothetical protein n=1 Tax=Nitrobacter sp. TKz-YC02 TaxID=3398704 RepID=UPI003CE82A7C